MTARRIGLVVAGLLIAALALVLSFLMAGAGHGWVTPLFFSLGLFLAYPIVLVRLTALSRRWLVIDIVMVALAALADISLVASTVQEGTQYFWRAIGEPVSLVWVATWLAWQALALHCLLRGLTGDGEPEQDGVFS